MFESEHKRAWQSVRLEIDAYLHPLPGLHGSGRCRPRKGATRPSHFNSDEFHRQRGRIPMHDLPLPVGHRDPRLGEDGRLMGIAD